MCIPPGGGSAPGVIYASMDISCGDTTYTISTGDNKGECKKSASGETGICGSPGNEAFVSCASGCIETKGSGSCSKKSMK